MRSEVLLCLFMLFMKLYASQMPCLFMTYIKTGQSKKFENPGYPRRLYPPGSHCEWRFFADPWVELTLDCREVKIPMRRNKCLDDFIVSNRQYVQSGVNRCRSSSIRYSSKASILTVVLASSPSSPGGKFSCVVYSRNVTSTHSMFRDYNAGCNCGRRYKEDMRSLTRGVETYENEYPFIAGIYNKSEKHIICGASIISPRFLITAAHCLYNKVIFDLEAIVGKHYTATGKNSSATESIKVDFTWIHPNYDKISFINDIAILMVHKDISFGDRVSPICLPFIHPKPYEPRVQILGWGLTKHGGKKPDRLQTVFQMIRPIKDCQVTDKKLDQQGQLCTYGAGHDSCQGDSGGPVFSNEFNFGRLILNGIISYGPPCGYNYTSVNTNVYHYLPWIQSIISSDPYCVV